MMRNKDVFYLIIPNIFPFSKLSYFLMFLSMPGAFLQCMDPADAVKFILAKVEYQSIT